ncbi:nSTAND1 domain-containing NTPase [Dactylosporangium darangshiense]|uniref:Novel STAND NTPase 1 domain-containing protein n=1 Tax=Dactylosporangium darangshiense TaxID=579108 RepID=A0ABP8DNK7_9ACTN
MSDPDGVQTRTDFARELTRIRERAALTVRQVAARAGADGAHSTIGDWFAGRGLPSLSSQDLLVRVLSVCGEVEVAPWLSAWHRARRRPAVRATGAEPYRGLASYQPEDAAWFFGRERLTAQLVDRVLALHAQGGGILMVVGASGAGKSSLLRAGVVPALPDVVLTTPAAQPLSELVTLLDTASTMVIDQFEELLTGGVPEPARREVIAALAASNTVVVLGLRADFYGPALRYAELLAAVQAGQFTVGPMLAAEVRAAIVEPARKAGVEIEDELVELLLDERSHLQDGVLPLLSHALYATWRQADGGPLTCAGYRAIGGIRGAVAETAADVYRTLDERQQRLARRLFLRLIHIGVDTVDTRRQVAWPDLMAEFSDDAVDLEDILDRFVAARLITADTETLRISHDALLGAWPTLRAWLDTDRATLVVGQQLAVAAAAWRRENADPALLYRGTRLAAARAWTAEHPEELSDVVREFLDASTRHSRRRVRQARQLIGALTVLALVTMALAVFGLDQRATANAARRAALDQRNQAVSRLVAGRADRLRSRDPSLAMQLSLAAYRISPTVEARSSLLDASAGPAVTRLGGFTNAVQAVAVSADHTLLAVGGADGTVRLWRLTTPDPLGPPLAGDGLTIFAVAISPDGHLLAAGGADKQVRLWNITDPARPVPVGSPLTGPASTVYSLAFSPDGQVLAAGSADHAIWRWDMAQQQPLPTLTGPTDAVQSVAFSPDGHILAAGSADALVHLWRVTGPTDVTPVGAPLAGHTLKVYSVAFSPGSTILASGSADDTVRLWDLSDPAHPTARGTPLTGATSWINAVTFSPDGTTIAAGTSDKNVIMWNVATGDRTATLPHPAPVTALAFGADGHTLATGGIDAMVRLWSLPGPVLTGPSDNVFSMSFTADSGELAVASRDRTVRLWNVHDRHRPAALGPALTSPSGHPAFSGTAVIRPDGRLLAVGTRTGEVQLWNVSRPAEPVLAAVLTGPTKLVETAAFSPDGTMLATGGDDSQVHLWNVRDPSQPVPLGTINDTGGLIFALAFRPGGTILAVATSDNTARLWDLTDATHPHQLGGPLGGFAGYAYGAAFSPDGLTLAVGSADRTVRLWNVSDPSHPAPLSTSLTGPMSDVFWVTFSPDGQTLAAASIDGTVWLWNITDRSRPAVFAVLTRANDSTYTVAFSPNGHTLAAAGADPQTRLWDTSPARVAAWVCTTAGTPITPAEWSQYVPGLPFDPPC